NGPRVGRRTAQLELRLVLAFRLVLLTIAFDCLGFVHAPRNAVADPDVPAGGAPALTWVRPRPRQRARADGASRRRAVPSGSLAPHSAGRGRSRPPPESEP